MSYYPTSTAPLPYTPASLELAYEEACVAADDAGHDYPDKPGHFLVKPMTEADFDRLGFELFRHNIVPPSQDTFRALLIEELYVFFSEAEAEEKANMLDGHWQAEDLYQEQMAEWKEQDRQRRADEARGAPKRDPEPVPTRTISVRERNRALLLAEDIRKKSRKLRDLSVEMQTYEPRQRAGIARLMIAGWEGFETPYAFEDDIVPEATYDALRSELGRDAMRDLEMFCVSMGQITGRERGNLELPPENEDGQDLSPPPSEGPETSDGSSTSGEEIIPSTSNFEPAQDIESAPVSGGSSPSSSHSTGGTATIAATPVARSWEPPLS